MSAGYSIPFGVGRPRYFVGYRGNMNSSERSGSWRRPPTPPVYLPSPSSPKSHHFSECSNAGDSCSLSAPPSNCASPSEPSESLSEPTATLTSDRRPSSFNFRRPFPPRFRGQGRSRGSFANSGHVPFTFSQRGRFRGRPFRGGPRGFANSGATHSTFRPSSEQSFSSKASSSQSSKNANGEYRQPNPQYDLKPVNRFEDPREPPEKWAIYCFKAYSISGSVADDEDDKALKKFTDRMINRGRFHGMAFTEPKKIQTMLISDLEDLEGFFRELASQHLDLVFIGLPDSYKQISNTDDVYSRIKSRCDNELSIITCCYKAEYVHNTPRNYFDNFLLKVNAKLGGVNVLFDPNYLAKHSIVNDKSQPIMIVGVVNHQIRFTSVNSFGLERESSQGDEFLEASISAVLASRDVHFAAYNSALRLQAKDPDNLVVNIDSMVRELLSEYYSANGGRYPSRVIVFRDGPCRAQFDRLLETEVPDLERMLVKKGETIKLSYIVVQRRSSPEASYRDFSEKCGKRMRSYPPVEVVNDEAVTDEDDDVFDLGGEKFFNKQWEQPAQTTRFIVLRNDPEEEEENDLSKAKLEHIAFYACQNYARSKTRIDIPTAIRYGDLCASRAHLLVNEELKRMTVTLATLAQNKKKIIRTLDAKVQHERALKGKLYFC